MDIVLTTHTDDRSARTHGATHRTAEETHAMPTGYMAPDKLGEKMEKVEAVPDGQSLHDVQWFEKNQQELLSRMRVLLAKPPVTAAVAVAMQMSRAWVDAGVKNVGLAFGAAGEPQRAVAFFPLEGGAAGLVTSELDSQDALALAVYSASLRAALVRRLLQEGRKLGGGEIGDVERVYLRGRAIADVLFSIVVAECELPHETGQLPGDVPGGTGTLEKSECQRMKKNVEEQQQLFEAHPETVAFIFSSSKALGTNYCHFYAHGSIGGNGIGGVVQCADANLVWNQHHHFFFAALHINLGACNVLTDHEVRASDERCAATGSNRRRCSRCAYWNFEKQMGQPPCGKGHRLKKFAYGVGEGTGVHACARAALVKAIVAVKAAGDAE